MPVNPVNLATDHTQIQGPQATSFDGGKAERLMPPRGNNHHHELDAEEAQRVSATHAEHVRQPAGTYVQQEIDRSTEGKALGIS